MLRSRFGAEVIIEPEVTDEIMSRVTRAENGARMLESVIDGNMLPPLSPAAVAENGGEYGGCPDSVVGSGRRIYGRRGRCSERRVRHKG